MIGRVKIFLDEHKYFFHTWFFYQRFILGTSVDLFRTVLYATILCNLEIRVVHAVSFYFLLVTFLNIILQIATKVCFVKLYIQLLYCIWYDTKCFEPENVIIFQLWALTIFNSTFVHARVKENQLGSFMSNYNTRAVSKQKIQ